MEPISTDALPPGTVIGGRYTVSAPLGVGGMSTVYVATDGWTGERVAVKVLNPTLAVHGEVVARFVQEAHTAASVAHPNVVAVIDVNEDRALGTYYIAQEFLDGMDLGRWTERRGAISPAEAVGIVVPVMSALIAAHARGVVHRDIKPENVFLAVGADGAMVPKLIDFGVSKITDASLGPNGRTRAGLAIGTPEYMSPEQARGDLDVDARSDVWSMGVMLYQLLTGRTPFEAATQTLLLVAIITEAPIPIERVAPHLPRALCEVVGHALQPDRARRYPSMQALLDALLQCPLEPDVAPHAEQRDHLSTSISLPTAQELGIAPPPAEVVRPPTTVGTAMQWSPAAPSPPKARRGAVWAIVGVVAAALVLVGVWARGRTDHGEEHASAAAPAAAPDTTAAPPAPAPVVPDVAQAEDAPTDVPASVVEDVPPAPPPSETAPVAWDASPAEAPAPAAIREDAGARVRPVGPRGPRRVFRRPRNNAPILAP